MIADPKERTYFQSLPTSFKLDHQQVDRLVKIGPKLLESHPRFVELLSELK